MTMATIRKETPVSMRFRDDDLAIIDRRAELLGLSRTEFKRRAALLRDISAPPSASPPKVVERLKRKAPWDD